MRTNYTAQKIAAAESRATKSKPNAVARLWLDPYNRTNLNDGENDYSACAFIFKSLSANTLSRGQSDECVLQCPTLLPACADRG